MSDIKPRQKRLRQVPPVQEREEKEWLGAEAHVPYHDRPIDWLRPLRNNGAGFNGLAIGLAFLSGTVLGGLLISILDRPRKSGS